MAESEEKETNCVLCYGNLSAEEIAAEIEMCSGCRREFLKEE